MTMSRALDRTTAMLKHLWLDSNHRMLCRSLPCTDSFALTVDKMMTRNSRPRNSYTEPSLMSDRPTLWSSTRIFSD